MKLVIIGGTGLIGSKLVSGLRKQGHEAVPASPDNGRQHPHWPGLAEALKARRSSSTSRTLVVRGVGRHGVLHHIHAQPSQVRGNKPA